MHETQQALGFKVRLNTDFETALSRVGAALKAEGFGVLTEIDVKTTLKNKLDVEFRPYRILGACNPVLAHRALQAVPEVGLLLPCNVTVSQEGDGSILVSIIDPQMMLSVVNAPEMEAIACEAHEKLACVAATLES